MSTSSQRSSSTPSPGAQLHPPAGHRPAVSLARCVLTAIALALAVPRVAHPQPAAPPQTSPLPNSSPLCSSNIVPCLDIDDFAAHAYAHLMILPETELRGTAVTIPYGISLGLLGRIAGGVSTSYTFWWQNGVLNRGHSPLRVSGTLLLWPLFPLHPQLLNPTDPSNPSDLHFVPSRCLRIGVTYDHELRVGPFDGANSLGLLADLSTIRIVASKALGLVELTLSVGALVDPQRQFATGEVAVRIGVYLPFLRSMRISAEAMARGVPAFVQPDLQAIVGDSAIHPQGVLGLDLSYRPHGRVDLGVSVQRGFGGLAPWAVIVRFLVLSLGKTYDGHSVTPIAQIAADAASYVVTAAKARIKEFIANLPIDPKLDHNCIIRDRDGSYMGRFGTLTADRKYCEQDGHKVPIDFEFWRDRASDRLCRESRKNPDTGKRELYDCVLWRHGREWLPAYQVRLNQKCELRDGEGKLLGQLGTPSSDGSQCRYPVTRDNGKYGRYTDYQEQSIGEIFYTDAERGSICENPNLTRCFVEHAEGRGTLRMTPLERLARGADRSVRHKGESLHAAAQAGEDVVDGKVSMTTIADEVRKEATEAATTITDPEKLKEIVQEKITFKLNAAEDWKNKPLDDQLDDAGKVITDGVVDAGVGLATGAAGHLAGDVLDAATDLRKLGKAGKAKKNARIAKGPRPKHLEASGHAPLAPASAPSIPEHLHTPDNLTRMKKGNAPHDSEGRPIELHHDGQQADSQLRPLTRDEHRGGENYKKNHPNTGQQPSNINRKEFEKQRRAFWKNQADKIKPE